MRRPPPRRLAILPLLQALVLSSWSVNDSTALVLEGTKSSQAAKLAQSDGPARGRVTTLVVFARFQNEDDGSAVPDFADRLFDPNLPGSLTHFYDEMSRGQFALDGVVLPRWYTSASPEGSYLADRDGEAGGYGRFVREILKLVDADTDFAQYDNDGPDGVPGSGDDDLYVDYLFIVMRSTPARFIATLATGVSGLGQFSPEFVTGDTNADGRLIAVRSDPGSGSLQQGQTFEEAVGTMAHEFGHALGLPDLFDTDFTSSVGELDPSEDSAGIGYWGLMGHGARGWDDRGGPNPFCAWSLEQLGWIGRDNDALIDVEDGLVSELVFDDVNAGGKVYKVPTRNPSAYYLIEHRRPGSSFYERHLPGAGLLVWHIDERNGGNRSEESKLVDLVCADGSFSDAGFPQGTLPTPDSSRDNLDHWAHDETYAREHAGNLGDATDVFDGTERVDFSVVSNPASKRGSSLTEIRRRGDRIAARLNLQDRRWAGSVEGAEIWSDTMEVLGDVVVPQDMSLTIEAGTVALFGPDRLLDVRGTLRSSRQGDPVLFSSAAARPQAGDWLGILVRPSARVDLSNATIEYSLDGISGSGGSSNHDLRQLEVATVARHGIQLSCQGRVRIIGVAVNDAPGTGLILEGGGDFEVADCRIVNSGGSGLVRRGGGLICRDSEFTGNGLNASTESAANIVLSSRVSGAISDNVLEGGVGIRCEVAGEVMIERNRMRNHSTAVVSITSSPRIERNVITDTELVFRVSGFNVPTRIVLNTVENPTALIESTSRVELLATRNWWGRDDETWVAERIEGPVLWQPVLAFDPQVPVSFALMQNWPNPFNGSTVIDYTVGFAPASVDHGSETILEVRSITGAVVRRLRQEPATPGLHTVVWDGRDTGGRPVASGVYLYQLKVGPIVFGKKLMVLR